MSDSNSNARRRAAELHVEMQDRLEDSRQRPLPSWLRKPIARIALTFSPAITFSLGIAAAFSAQNSLGLVLLSLALVTGATGTIFLRLAINRLDNAPRKVLDERELAQRNRAFGRAFQLALAIVGMLWALAVIDQFAAGPIQLLGGNSWIFITLTAVVTMTMVPAAVILWSARLGSDHNE
ncbi:hypothetical protein D6T64_05435 [Cryobacterium melibiosiphilum]|uniref:Uncharacterized protein n=1 Tax=Cryobacterium melibiosiphilum TaxID=995039 RepID=A0A3A5MKJ0_9MICO|nr:hypothetical protein [Cryobacterium melibiosiphilum]RJT89902.1 hypothetical protein D6T64_05435 [Cryobacterium melibiosiphilum]